MRPGKESPPKRDLDLDKIWRDLKEKPPGKSPNDGRPTDRQEDPRPQPTSG